MAEAKFLLQRCRHIGMDGHCRLHGDIQGDVLGRLCGESEVTWPEMVR